MTIIEATSVSFKSMADGSLRQTIEYSPIHAQDAFKLYGGVPGAPMGTFRLTQEAAKHSAQSETIAADKQKGGALAKLAGMWCLEINFWNWLNSLPESMSVESKTDAINNIYYICTIKSRADLDNNPEAADKFHRLIRIPYGEYLKSV